MESYKKEILIRIARILMLHGSFTNNLGLINGKMGIIIFFFHLSKYTQKKIYEDFAGEMIDEIYKEVHNHCSCDFENGLSGIAWGIEYLIQNQFVKANANEVLEDLDKKILEWDVRRINDYSLETGLQGIAQYVISRCREKSNDQNLISKDYVSDLIIALKKNPNNDIDISITLKNLVNSECVKNKDCILISLISKIKFNPTDIFNNSRVLGIGKNGYAGIGLKLLLDK